MIFGPPNQEPRLEDLSLLLGHTCDPQTCMSEAAPTTLTAQPTPLQGHTYDPETRMSGAHLRPSQLHLRPFKVTPTTLKPHVRSPPTTFTAPPTTLQGHTYDPQTCMSGSHDDPFRTLAEYKGIPQSASKEEGSNTDPSEKLFLALYGVHIAKAQNVANVFLSNCALSFASFFFYHR